MGGNFRMPHFVTEEYGSEIGPTGIAIYMVIRMYEDNADLLEEIGGKLTQTTIAETIGTGRETVSKHLGKLKHVGLINDNQSGLGMRSRKMSGFVYLLHGEGTPWYKIGLSRSPNERVKKLNREKGTMGPFKINALHTISVDDMEAVERFLHNRYEDKRLEGEWFELDGPDIEEISSIWRASGEPWGVEQIASLIGGVRA